MMDSLFTYPSDSLIHAAGWALIHSLWQGSAIALMLAVILRAFPGVPGAGSGAKASSKSRYVVACASLVAVVGLIVLTFVYYADMGQTYREQPVVAGTAIPIELTTVNVAPPLSTQSLVTAELSTGPLELVERYLPWMVLAWLSGMAIVSLRLLTGWGLLRRMCCNGVSPISPVLQARVTVLCQTMKVRRFVRVLESTRAVTPMVIGWVRPVVLLPTASLTGLSSQQLEAVIAHELAHVLRHDYLVNLLQCVAETLLFYHPGVWWIGRVIRQERERCCDDLAVKVSGDRVDYARALLHIAESAPPHRARLSLASQGGDLSQRVRRLLGIPSPPPHTRWTAGLWTTVASLCLVAVFVVGVRADNKNEVNEEVKIAVSQGTMTDPASPDAEVKTKQRIIDIPYQKLIGGDPSYNIVIRPGDVIRVVPDVGGFVYLGGEVKRPGAYNIPGSHDLTLKQLIVSGGGVHSPNRFVKLVRRLGPDTEETLHFSLDDIFDGWAQDAFLAPNDVIQISSEPGPEDEQAKERRLLREQLPGMKTALVKLSEQLKNATLELEDGDQLIQSLEDKIKSAETELAKIKKQLRPEGEPVVMKIIPAPENRWVGKAPRPEDLLVHPLPNTARSKDKVSVTAIRYGDNSEQTTFQRILDSEGVLNLPGIGAVKFLGRPIDELEAEVLSKMKAKEAYSQTEQVSINLPGRWYFAVMSQPQPGGGGIPLYKISRADFRLRDALRMVRGVPTDTKIIRVIRQEPIPLTSTQP